MYFFFLNGEEKKCTYSPWVSGFFFFLPSSSQRFHTRRCVRPVCPPEGNGVALPSWIWWKKKNVSGSVTWRSLKRKSLRLEDERSQPADLQPERQIFSSLCETESWYLAIRQEFVRAESPDLRSLPRPTPHPSPPWPLIILLNWNPHLSSQKQELFKQTTLTTTLESYFHAQKFEKSFFFLTPWGVGVIPFTNMQTEGTVGGGDKMIQLMLHNRGWIWTKAKLCFLDFMLPLTATCIFLSTFPPAETQLAIETDYPGKSSSWDEERLVTNMLLWMEKLPRLPRIPLIQIISADQGSLILIRQLLKGVTVFPPIFFLLTP